MISGSSAFDEVLAAIRPTLDAHGFAPVEAREHGEAFGSRYAVFGDGRRMVRLVWDGHDQLFVLEAEPRVGAAPVPMWLDLTLQRFDPQQADGRWVAEIIEDVRDALDGYLAHGGEW
jgi:hypothetical protein